MFFGAFSCCFPHQIFYGLGFAQAHKIFFWVPLALGFAKFFAFFRVALNNFWFKRAKGKDFTLKRKSKTTFCHPTKPVKEKSLSEAPYQKHPKIFDKNLEKKER